MENFSLQEGRFELAGMEIETAVLRIHRDNQVEPVEPKTMQVLLVLVRQAGEVDTREALDSGRLSGGQLTKLAQYVKRNSFRL